MGRPLDERLARLLGEFEASGDDEVMEELVAISRPKLLAAARRIVPEEDAGDAVGAAYLSLLRKGADLGGAPPFAWLPTAVVRLAYRRRAKGNRELEIARRLAQPPAAQDPASLAGEREIRERLGERPATAEWNDLVSRACGMPRRTARVAPEEGAFLLTDDYAPLERLTDRYLDEHETEFLR